MKHYIALLSLTCVLASCNAAPITSSDISSSLPSSEPSSSESSSSEVTPSIKDRLHQLKQYFESPADGHKDEPLLEIEKELMQSNIYKTQARIKSYTKSRFIDPFCENETRYYPAIKDFENLICTTTFIKNKDREYFMNHAFVNKEAAINYLIEQGYTIKNDIVLPTSFSSYLENEPLYYVRHNGTIAQNLSKNYSVTEGYAYFTLDNYNILDDEGEVLHHIVPQDFKNTFRAIDPLVAFRVGNSCLLPSNPYTPHFSDGLFFNRYYSIIKEDNNLKMTAVDERYPNITFSEDEAECDLVYLYEEDDESYYTNRYYNSDITYGSILSFEGGNENYQTMMENDYFRASLLALLDRKDYGTFSTSGHNSFKYYQEENNHVVITNDKRRDYYYKVETFLPEHDNGIEEAKKYVSLMGDELMDDVVLHTLLLKNSEAYIYLDNAIKKVYQGKVRLERKNVSVDFVARPYKEQLKWDLQHNFFASFYLDNGGYYANYGALSNIFYLIK